MTGLIDPLERLRFPIGRAVIRPGIGERERAALIDRLAAQPGKLRAIVRSLPPDALDRPYRPGGWTAREVIHHLPDSHANAYVRFRLAVTEDEPTVKPYREAEWARLSDSTGPVALSLDLMDGLHARWTFWLRTLREAEWGRAYRHPEDGRVPLDHALQLYVWHGDHHLAHVASVAPIDR